MEPRETGGPGPALQYVQAVLAVLDRLEGNLGSTGHLASEAASRLVNGGRLHAVDDGGAFVAEVAGRSGGMMMLSALEASTAVKEGDVVIAGTSDLEPDAQAQQLRRLAAAGAMIVLVGSSESPLRNLVSAFIDNGLPKGTAPLVRLRGRQICPGSTVANIAAAWVFIGELVAACTRLGKMPTMYLSVYIPASKAWNACYIGQPFHDDRTIMPLASGSLGEVYLSSIRRCCLGLRNTQLPSFAEAGRMAADARAAGHTAWYCWNGHHLGGQLGLPGDPDLLRPGVPADLALAAEDVFVWLGYYDLPEPELAMVERARCQSIWICGARSVNPVPLVPGRVVIDPYWGFGDASVAIPGYDVRILPPSGVIQTACLWMLVAEMASSFGG